MKEALEQTVSLLNESSEKLQKVSTTLSTDGSDGVQMLEKILAEDPQTIGAFLAAPVSLNETKIYPIENYGTAMAPFYSTLAIWVGAVVMAAMLKVNVSESVVKKLSGAKPHLLWTSAPLCMYRAVTERTDLSGRPVFPWYSVRTSFPVPGNGLVYKFCLCQSDLCTDCLLW